MKLRFPSFSTATKSSNYLLSRSLHCSATSNLIPPQNAAFPDSESLRDPYALNKIIFRCSETGSFSTAAQLHSHVLKTGFHGNVYINTSLISVYSRCAEILSAHQLFDEMPEKNAVTWSALISGYVKARDPSTAVKLFVSMMRSGVGLTPHCVSTAAVACAQLEDGELGAQVHGLSLKMGLESNVAVGSSLIDLYAKCGDMEVSRKVFDGLVDKNVVAWNSMIGGYVYNHCSNNPMILMREMLRSGFKANNVTYNILLSSFLFPDDFTHCCQIHCRVIKEGLKSDSFIATTLVTLYSECSCNLKEYNQIISSVSEWDQVAWNAVIAGFANLGAAEEAFVYFRNMRRANLAVNFYTFSSVLKALGKASSLEEGKQVHSLVSKTCHSRNLYIQNGLVSMYARCGKIDKAKKVFALMDEHDLISWNSLLTGCAHHGHGVEAIQIFEQMRRSGVSPNQTTFLAALTACSHAGLLEKGLKYFSMMKKDYSLAPQLEHYACMVDLYGRLGFFDEAEAFINGMPIEQGPSVYKALLSASLVHGNKEVALRSVRKLVELCPDDPAIYVLLANVLASEGCWSDAERARKVICERGVMKKPGCSRI